MLLLTDEELQLHQDSTVCYKFTQKPAKDRNYCKVRDHCHFIEAQLIDSVIQDLMFPRKFN